MWKLQPKSFFGVLHFPYVFRWAPSLYPSPLHCSQRCNQSSIAVGMFCHWKGGFLHCGGTKFLNLTICRSPLGFSNIQLITSFTQKTINNSCGDEPEVMGNNKKKRSFRACDCGCIDEFHVEQLEQLRANVPQILVLAWSYNSLPISFCPVCRKGVEAVLSSSRRIVFKYNVSNIQLDSGMRSENTVLGTHPFNFILNFLYL